MRALEDLKEMLCKELDDIAMKGELTAGDLETTHKLTDTIKNIDKIMMLEEGEGYSGSEWTARGSYDDGMRMGNRMSNRGYSGRHYVRGHYSRAEGKDMMVQQIREMMMTAEPSDKKILQRAMDELQR